MIFDLGKKFRTIITVEEHIVNGGLGGIVAETLMEQHARANLYKLGLPNTFLRIGGSHSYLRERLGLSPSKLASQIAKIVKND